MKHRGLKSSRNLQSIDKFIGQQWHKKLFKFN